MISTQDCVFCIECEDTEALYTCENCDDVYCSLCYDSQHRSGSRLRHIKVLLKQQNFPLKHVIKTDIKHISTLPIDSETIYSLDLDLSLITTLRSDSFDALKESQYIPLRLSEEERSLYHLLDASLSVSEYTDKVDILSYRSPAKRILIELKEVFSTIYGLLLANDFQNGNKLVHKKPFEDNQVIFQQIFEIGRRYKMMNPEKMRENYGKMIYLLQDANIREIKQATKCSCVESIKTVANMLEEKDSLALLSDSRLKMATINIPTDSVHRLQALELKNKAIEELMSEYASDSVSSHEINQCLASISDYKCYLESNTFPIDRMLEYLQTLFQSDKAESGFSLDIKAGRNGARLSHNHTTQYNYVLQSLMLWRNITKEMLKLWWAVEEDLLKGSIYRLRDTGQGLNRVQNAPHTSRLVHDILSTTQTKHSRWIGSSVIHLGDHNVPNALMFIDKYTQISRILSPIVNTIDEIPKIAQQFETKQYIDEVFGGSNSLQKKILCDFFKHAFDGSGADNFFDAGSCIDGRLTSAWNWCSNIEKKPFFHVFLIAGFVGFNGQFDK